MQLAILLLTFIQGNFVIHRYVVIDTQKYTHVYKYTHKYLIESS